ncbi:MAG: hypothetical protein M9916_09730 [Crocinitomicaceae bacterium]|nr:hypothetical protein [Crocinitomicaceae bacterium]
MIKDFFQQEIERLGKAVQAVVGKFTSINPDFDSTEICVLIQANGNLNALYAETDLDKFAQLVNEPVVSSKTKLDLIKLFYELSINGDIENRELNRKKCLITLDHSDIISFETLHIKQALEKK